MQQEALNSGVIFTNKNCIGCNKCISGCPVSGANVVVKDEEFDCYTVLVDANKCILCGACVSSCVHNARTYRDDTDAFLMDLDNGEKISILVAPTLLTDYEKQYYNILGYLKNLGVGHIYNTGFGADIMIWVYMNFIHNYGLAGVISQFCPVIVNYLEKYRPELLKYLMPVQSPVMCTAIYVSDYLGIDDKLAYISPCIAGKYEIEDVNTYGKITYNVTFERLMKRIEDIDLSSYYAEDEVNYGLGALVSTTGGLSENIKQYIGFNEVLIQTSGPANIFPYFDHYFYKEINGNSELPFLVDALSCTDGCSFGTGTSCGYEMRNEMSFSSHRAKEKAFQSGNAFGAFSFKERLEKMNARFEDQFELSSFVRQYGNTRCLKSVTVSEKEIEEIYHSMYKEYESRRHTDCGACGYKTCRQMAHAIGTHINYKENCINYSKERIRREKERTNQLLKEISGMNEELKRSTQLKSNFLANMSHEIRTPMNAIIGMAEIALRGDLKGEEREYLQQIKASGRSLLAIINDILDFSKIESGKMELNEGEYAVMSIINDTVNMVMARIGEKNISFIVDADPDIPFKLVGDDIRIKQVLVNMTNNAIKFTNSGYVKISMGYERSDEGIVLKVSVEDTGIGIKIEDQEKLFTSFQQVDSKRNRNIEGTGLGLAISREFIIMMGGEVSLSSTYGKGSIFSFCIPQKIAEDIPSIIVKEENHLKVVSLINNRYIRENFGTAIQRLGLDYRECAMADDLEAILEGGAGAIFIEYCHWGPYLDRLIGQYPNLKTVIIVDPRKQIVSETYVYKINQPVYALNIASILNNEENIFYECDDHAGEMQFEAPEAKILIVDDNTINLTVAQGLLAPLHMGITAASSAMEAIRFLEKTHFDIIFMDHMMPDIDGIEATHMIRKKKGDYYTNIPIIALTANAINHAKEMFMAEGMNDFVAKPIDMNDIMNKLRKWLPPDKIRNVTRNDRTRRAEVKREDFPQLQGINTEDGLRLSGTRELYEAILRDYYEAIEKKAACIEKYEAEGDLTAYTIEVHALKSASRLIGANELGTLAERLEKCGHEKDTAAMKEKTKEMLDTYRSYLTILAAFARKEDHREKTAIAADILTEKLTSLYEALDEFELDQANTIVEELQLCLFNEKGNEILHSLSEAVAAMEYEDAQKLAAQWKESAESSIAV